MDRFCFKISLFKVVRRVLFSTSCLCRFPPVSVFTCVALVNHVVVFKPVFHWLVVSLSVFVLWIRPDFHIYPPVLCSRVLALFLRRFLWFHWFFMGLGFIRLLLCDISVWKKAVVVRHIAETWPVAEPLLANLCTTPYLWCKCEVSMCNSLDQLCSRECFFTHRHVDRKRQMPPGQQSVRHEN